MRKKYFYTEIIDSSSLIIELDKLSLDQKEKDHLIYLIDSNIHHGILDLILSELNVHDKKTFLSHLASENHDKVWKLIKDKINNIEEKIKKTAGDVKKQLHEDVKAVKEEKD
jgi:hypothetical protein